MSKTIQPLGARVVIQAVENEEKVSASGFVVAASAQKNDRPQVGKIIKIGPDVSSLTIGDEVVFKEFIPTAFELEDQKYLILLEEDILAIIA